MTPNVAAAVDQADYITSYDMTHLFTYARVLDAALHGITWFIGADDILGRDVVSDPEEARRCWDSHLARARWLETRGYALLRTQAGLED